uniref:Transmembrane and coiled-coil domain-containing protein 4 n=1 Tax=Strongyloides papillosus TaxID=174720 RepID=A0A0N5B3F4_STREA
MDNNDKTITRNKEVEVFFDQRSFAGIPKNVKYQVCEYFICVLKKHFYKYGSDNSRMFCFKVLSSIKKCNNYDKPIMDTFRNQLCDYELMIPLDVATENIKSLNGEHNYDECLVIICRIFVTYLKDGIYDSRFRVLLKKILSLLSIDLKVFEECENYLASELSVQKYIETDEQKKRRKKGERNRNIKRWALIGASGVIGGTLVGITGGLAAPLIASGAAALVGTSLTAGIATATGATILGIGFGIAGAGLTGYKMKTRIGNVEEFKFVEISREKSLDTLITITGWIGKKKGDSEFIKPWKNLRISKEEYTLVYESEHLLNLGQSFKLLIKKVTGAAFESVLSQTILAGLMSAVAWPMGLLGIADIIDNPWNVCMSRSEEVGELLCDVLMKRIHGQKPVSLIGYSIGARVIFYCLLKMVDSNDSEGIIEDVILLGTPVTASTEEWEKVSKVVSGRIINGYSTTDWILSFLYRTMNVQFSIAGISPIEVGNCYKKKVINHDLSKIVKGHLEYGNKIDDIMKELGVVTVNRHSNQISREEIRDESRENNVSNDN